MTLRYVFMDLLDLAFLGSAAIQEALPWPAEAGIGNEVVMNGCSKPHACPGYCSNPEESVCGVDSGVSGPESAASSSAADDTDFVWAAAVMDRANAG